MKIKINFKKILTEITKWISDTNQGIRNEFTKTLSASIKMLSMCLCFSVLKIIFISDYGLSQSILNYQTGTAIEVQTGASVCADSVLISGTFTGGGAICGFSYSLNLTAFIEGFYDVSSDLMVSDTVTVTLRDTISPFAVIDTYKSLLSSSGTGTFFFPNAQNGKSYYLQVTHRNSIETWSVITAPFTGGSLTYIFSDAITKAYGNNMKQVDVSPVVFALFGGDVNQDGTIDASDLSEVDNAVMIALSGYVNTDLNGDNFVDASDLSIVENNASNSVSAVTP